MEKEIPISQKRGFPINSCGGILVKANMNSINTIFSKYFEFKIHSNCSEHKYVKLCNKFNNKQSRLSSIIRKASGNYRRKIEKKLANLPHIFTIWKFYNHHYCILGFNGTCDDIAFAFSTLLDTDVLIYSEPKHDYCNELKLFRGDRLVEHYMFGSECGSIYNKYWDTVINYGAISHRFCSSIRQITEEEIKQFTSNPQNIGEDCTFLDSCVKYHDAYFPKEVETPEVYLYYRKKAHLLNFRNSVEQMSIIMIPHNWNYCDWKVPKRVNKD